MRRLLLIVPTTTYRAGAFVDAAASIPALEVAVASQTPSSLTDVLPHGLPAFPFDPPEAAARAAAAWATRHPVDAVVGVDDAAAPVAAAIASRLGLPHHRPEAVATCRDKLRTRRACARAGVAQPAWRPLGPGQRAGRVAAALGLPVVIKLRNGSASTGVLRANTPDEADAAARRVRAIAASRGDRRATLVVERFVEGPEVAVEGIVDGGHVHVLAVFDKPEPLDGPTFPETIYVTPSQLDPATLDAVRGLVARTVRATGLSFGPFHAEVRVGADGPCLIEIAPRSIGGRCAAALRFEGGESLERVVLRHALERRLESRPRREAPASGVCMLPVPRAGVVESVEGVGAARALSGVDDVTITTHVGRRVRPLPESGEYLGFVFARADRPQTVVHTLRTARSRVRIRIRQPARASDAAPAASRSAASTA